MILLWRIFLLNKHVLFIKPTQLLHLLKRKTIFWLLKCNVSHEIFVAKKTTNILINMHFPSHKISFILHKLKVYKLLSFILKYLPNRFVAWRPDLRFQHKKAVLCIHFHWEMYIHGLNYAIHYSVTSNYGLGFKSIQNPPVLSQEIYIIKTITFYKSILFKEC